MDDSRTIAEITLVHPELVLTPTIERVPEMITELEYQTIVEPGEYYLFFKAYGGVRTDADPAGDPRDRLRTRLLRRPTKRHSSGTRERAS